MPLTRFTEIIASSSKSFDDAVNVGLKKAIRTLASITDLEVVSMKAKINEGKIKEYKVKLKVTFNIKK
jgi:hypothetical protein